MTSNGRFWKVSKMLLLSENTVLRISSIEMIVPSSLGKELSKLETYTRTTLFV